MRTSTIVIIAVLVVAVVVGLVVYFSLNTNNSQTASNTQTSNTSGTNNSTNSTPDTNTTTPVQNVVLTKATSSTLGTYLTSAANGLTLYMYTKDTPGVSNCTGTCAAQWLPYTVASADGLAGAVGINGQIGTILRTDGTMQVTYNNEPLYYYSKDKAVGDTNGQNLGKLWFVVKP